MRLLLVLLRIETLKAVKRPAFWVATGVFVLFNGLFTFGSIAQARGTDRVFALPDVWRAIIEPAINLGPTILAAVMILLFAPEFRWKTARQNVIDGLGKQQFYLGKIIVLRSLVALFFFIPIVIGGVGAIVSPGEGGAAFVESMDLLYMLGYITALLLWGSGGFMLAALVRAAGPALGLLFAYFIVEQLVGRMIAVWWRTLEPIMDFLPASLFTTITDAKLYYPLLLARDNEMRAANGMDPLVLPDLWIPLVAAAAYIVLFLGLAFVNMRRRDL